MRGFNKVVLAGNLTRDPEVRTTPNGAQVCSFSLAVNRTYKGSNGDNVDEVSYFDIVAWGKLGETIAKYAKKGTGMLVSGRLSQRSWEDKNGGGKRSRVELVLEDFNFLGGGAGSEGGSYNSSASAGKNSSTSKTDNAAEPEVIPDDIPEEGEVDLNDIPF